MFGPKKRALLEFGFFGLDPPPPPPYNSRNTHTKLLEIVPFVFVVSKIAIIIIYTVLLIYIFWFRLRFGHSSEGN